MTSNKQAYQKEYYRKNADKLRACARSNYKNSNPVIQKEKRTAYYQAHRDEILAQKKAYTLQTRDHRRLYNAEYRKQNRDALLAKDRERHTKGSPGYEKVLEKNRAYAKTHRTILNAIQNRWNIKNLEKIRAYQRKYSKSGKASEKATRRKARLNGCHTDYTAALFYQAVRSKKTIPCYYCGKVISGKSAHVDHIVSIAENGNHSSDNLCATCPSCNCSKREKRVSQWKKTGQLIFDV